VGGGGARPGPIHADAARLREFPPCARIPSRLMCPAASAQALATRSLFALTILWAATVSAAARTAAAQPLHLLAVHKRHDRPPQCSEHDGPAAPLPIVVCGLTQSHPLPPTSRTNGRAGTGVHDSRPQRTQPSLVRSPPHAAPQTLHQHSCPAPELGLCARLITRLLTLLLCPALVDGLHARGLQGPRAHQLQEVCRLGLRLASRPYCPCRVIWGRPAV
jgi:hypothetical protein